MVTTFKEGQKVPEAEGDSMTLSIFEGILEDEGAHHDLFTSSKGKTRWA